MQKRILTVLIVYNIVILVVVFVVWNHKANQPAIADSLPTLAPASTQVGTATALVPALTPTNTLVPTTTPVPQVEGYITNEADVQLTANPNNPETAPLLMLVNSTRVLITGQSMDGEWFRVEISGLRGWVKAESITPDDTLESLPFIDLATYPSSDDPVEAEMDYTTSHQYISNVTDNALAIYRDGQEQGNRSFVFSKVGDSITAAPEFLTPIGNGDYDLGEHTYLEPVLDAFSEEVARDANSFANTSLAAENGWGAGSLLKPENANPILCFEGETPLACEYRAVRPSIALIMIGVNDIKFVSTDYYRGQLEEIIQITIDAGIIPVVSTLPPIVNEENPTRVNSYNVAIREVALEYDIPLWDYGAAMQPLGSGGLWDDGIHPNWREPTVFTPINLQFGMTVRNLTALQALDSVWQQIILHDGM